MSKITTPTAESGGVDAANTSKEAPLILVVDDFEDGREMYASYLRFSGYRVDEAADGNEALEKAFTLRPDIILMDLSLPGIDGWQATRELKRDERTANIPIVALTGHALEAHSRSAKEAGCDAFIVKPCMPMDLLNEIRRILDSAEKNRGD
ncbi:MAG TPA: response regulator [Polyangiaceae bacterium]|jgi:CheY-like chemotaxis protein|nr:response regulator [Polyangiaceae bacterium]